MKHEANKRSFLKIFSPFEFEKIYQNNLGSRYLQTSARKSLFLVLLD